MVKPEVLTGIVIDRAPAALVLARQRLAVRASGPSCYFTAPPLPPDPLADALRRLFDAARPVVAEWLARKIEP